MEDLIQCPAWLSLAMDAGMARVKICHATTSERLAAARVLFLEYAAWVGVDLTFQGFAGELENLPGMYGPPRGRLLLGELDGKPVGCVALRPLDESTCEMKRLFVRSDFRGQGLGRALVETVLNEARQLGYATLKLDTLPFMREASRLYEAFGFVRCPPYYSTALEETVFLELTL